MMELSTTLWAISKAMLGCSQNELARLLGMSSGAASRVAQGQTSISVEQVLQLAETVGLDAWELVWLGQNRDELAAAQPEPEPEPEPEPVPVPRRRVVEPEPVPEPALDDRLHVALVGGAENNEALARLARDLPDYRFTWIPSTRGRGTKSNSSGFLKKVAGTKADALLTLARFGGGSVHQVPRVAREIGLPHTVVPGGYGTSSIKAALSRLGL